MLSLETPFYHWRAAQSVNVAPSLSLTFLKSNSRIIMLFLPWRVVRRIHWKTVREGLSQKSWQVFIISQNLSMGFSLPEVQTLPWRLNNSETKIHPHTPLLFWLSITPNMNLLFQLDICTHILSGCGWCEKIKSREIQDTEEPWQEHQMRWQNLDSNKQFRHRFFFLTRLLMVECTNSASLTWKKWSRLAFWLSLFSKCVTLGCSL